MKKVIFVLFFIFLFTLPLFAQTDTAWVRSYNGSANVFDWATSLAIGASDTIYVTGVVDYGLSGGTKATDWATIKYFPNGDTAWVRRYNGTGDSTDMAFAIAVDNTGNVCVTGGSLGIGTSEDCATIKYYPNGDTAWVRRYNGPGNAGDRGNAITVDASGNVYVTGVSRGTAGTLYDYLTIKYLPNGNIASGWPKRYNGPGAGDDIASSIAVDGAGNIYVTGNSIGAGTNNQDYATIKYYPNGDTAWVRRYNGGNYSFNYDYAVAIAVDGSGNVYVTGYSGEPNYTNDYVTIKYDPNGNALWTSRWNQEEDKASDLAVDASGNVYVTGTTWAPPQYGDYVTIKYYPNGDTAWVRTYGGASNSEDYASAIALDQFGNAYVTGSSGTDPYVDYVTIKYYPTGDTGWLRRYSGSYRDFAKSLAVSCSENVYVTGSSSTHYTDYATVKYFQFKRGDANADGTVTVADVVYLIAYLYKGGPAPNPLEKGDVNCDCRVDSGDVTYLVNYLFKHGPQPC